MNFKRNLLTIIALIGSALMAPGCTNPNIFKEFEFLDPQKDLKQAVDEHEDEEFDNYIKFGDYDSYMAKGSGSKIYDLGDTYSVLYNYGGEHIMHSTGEQKIIVVPVEFEDFTIEDLGVDREDYLDNLEKAFFGISANNKYLSVSEYYNRSSYGQLKLSGKVCNKFYTFPKTTEAIISGDLSSNIVRQCYDDVLKWIKSTYPSIDLDEYRIEPEESNSDIALYLIYTYPTELKQNTKVFWNYTFLDKPFAWSSYSCLDTLSGKPDAHTLIHETGHLMGLPDYYPSNESDPDPAGRIDMMDCSVGDHSGFSKMMLNWARPYYVQDSCEITVRNLSNYGDLILINDKWSNPEVVGKAKKTVFDEYFLIELYSPTGINSFDASIGNNKAKLPSLPGIKIYHVDSRIGYFKSERDMKSFLHYCDSTVENAVDPLSGNVGLAHTNSATSTIVNQPTNYLYELCLNNSKILTDAYATDEHLYHKGDTFEITDDMWHDKNDTVYKITVTSLNFTEAKIKIESTKTTTETLN